ncbi:MAG: proton-conducting transporter membrane subunit, partial [Candidatus Omnitrophota bacterium]|nr:proton-conducting transporter membrane subunit [Candidatus Omnitrophota bacterium]
MPSLFILIPIVGLIILNLPFRDIMKRLAFWFAFALFCTQIFMALFNRAGFWSSQFEMMDSFFNVPFSVDYLTFLMLLSIGIVSLSSLLVSRYTISYGEERFNFINLLIIASIGMCGIVLVRDLFSMYVFLEITAVASFILIAFDRDRQALEGAFKYIVLSAVATIMMLASIALILMVSGSTSFDAVASAFKGSAPNPVMTLSIALFVCGLLIKGGIVPFHGWLPDAYSTASPPVSVLLAGIVTKTCGIYTLMRLVTSVFGFTPQIEIVLLVAGTLSVLVGAFAALGQSNFNRMLAYSSISQIGYIILGLGTGSALGIAGAAFHIFNHAIFKSQLFINAAAVRVASGTKDMDDMGGLSSKMPVTGATSVIAMLSTCGVPPFAGFWSKLMIIVALWQTGHVAFGVIAVLASILTLAYMLSMQRRVFFGKVAEGLENVREANFGFSAVSIALSIITIAAGLLFPLVFNGLLMPLAG